MDILYEDAYILAAVKPPGMPSQPDKTGDEDFLSRGLAYLEQSSQNPYLAEITRLDRPVGGIVLFGKTPQAAAALSKALAAGKFQKEYLAALMGTLPNQQGELSDYLLKNGKTNLSVVVNENTKGAKQARLRYKVLQEQETEYGVLSLVHIHLLTGRHHQIRVQTAHAGAGIWGDKKYNQQKTKGRKFGNVALWAYRLTFMHPIDNKEITVSQIPESHPFTLFQDIKI